MKLAPLLIAWLGIALLLAGCFSDKPSGPGPSTTGATSSSATSTSFSQTSTTTGPRPGSEDPLTLILSGCNGWTAVQNYPGPTGPGPRPTGWGPKDPTSLITGITIQAFKCNRIALGDFERGPLHVLYEYHNNANVPEDCLKELAGVVDVGILTHLLIDDGELAKILKDQLQLPVSVATITDSSTSAGPSAVHSWAWQTEGGLESTLMVPDSGDYSGSGGLPERLFWESNGTIQQADFVGQDTGPQVPAVAEGTIQPPFYAGSQTQGAFASFGTYSNTREASGTFTSYGDMQCKVPK